MRAGKNCSSSGRARSFSLSSIMSTWLGRGRRSCQSPQATEQQLPRHRFHQILVCAEMEPLPGIVRRGDHQHRNLACLRAFLTEASRFQVSSPSKSTSSTIAGGLSAESRLSASRMLPTATMRNSVFLSQREYIVSNRQRICTILDHPHRDALKIVLVRGTRCLRLRLAKVQHLQFAAFFLSFWRQSFHAFANMTEPLNGRTSAISEVRGVKKFVSDELKGKRVLPFLLRMVLSRSR
jgi:hypothetical protein